MNKKKTICRVIGHKPTDLTQKKDYRYWWQGRCARCGTHIEKHCDPYTGKSCYIHEFDANGRHIRGPPFLQMALHRDNRKYWAWMGPVLIVFAIAVRTKYSLHAMAGFLAIVWGYIIYLERKDAQIERGET